MADYMKQGREAYEDGKPCEPPSHLSKMNQNAWEDGWLDAAAEDPDNDEVSWADAGHPEWDN